VLTLGAMGTKDAMSAALKIATPIQLAGVIVVGIIQIALISSSPLAIVSVAILGGLGVLATVVIVVSRKQQNNFLIGSRRQENEFVVQSGILRLEILIEWIAKFRERTTNIEVCRELDARLQELQDSLNYSLRQRSDQ